MISLTPQPDAPSKPPATAKKTSLEEEDDFLEELPPMDGDDDAKGVDDASDNLGEDDIATEESSLDDSTMGGDPGLGVDLLGTEGGNLDDARDARDADDLDVGEGVGDLAEAKGLLEDLDELGVGEEDFGLVGGRDSGELDRGEEGPDTADDELREDELPEMDADDEGEGEGESNPRPRAITADPWAVPGDDVQHPWDDRAWQRAGVPLRVGGMGGVVVLTPGALAMAGGKVLATATPAGTCAVAEAKGLEGQVIEGLVAGGENLVAATPADGLFVSRDAGATFAPRNGWRDSLAPADARRASAMAATAGDLWVVTRTGRLLAGRDSGATWSEPLRGVRVTAVQATGGDEIAALGLAAPTGEARLVLGSASTLHVEALPSLPRGIRMGVGAPFVRAPGALAFVLEGVGVFRLVDGDAWERIEGTADATALTFIDAKGTLVVALYDVEGERSFLLRVPAKATPRIVAELGGELEDADAPSKVSALAWDAVANIVWVSGTFGLTAFRVS